MTASAISRMLRQGGLAVTPAAREGIHVTGQFIRLDFDLDRHALEARDSVEEILAERGVGIFRVSDRVLRYERKEN